MVKRPTRENAETAPPLPIYPPESARIVGLRYVRDGGPGIARRRAGKGFFYIGPSGKIISNPLVLKRIRSLAIPPAWKDVWISPLSHAHLQAVGRDAKGRKQYRYHPMYRQIREQTKFERMLPFGHHLPKIRQRVKRDLKLIGTPKAKVLATIVRLLETSCIRIGNQDYAAENGSYGLTTLRNNHVRISGRKIRFHFRGKSKQMHDVILDDPRLAKIIRRCQCLPGQELFQYVEEDGEPCRISSEDVNEYLGSTTGEYFTAKDFRTWVGTVEAFRLLRQAGPSASAAEAKQKYTEVVKEVAARLGNRPATAKKSYIHPEIFECYTDGTLFEAAPEPKNTNPTGIRRADELCLIRLLSKRRKLGNIKKREQNSKRELGIAHRRHAA
jgi:DNA topoisomerase-1